MQITVYYDDEADDAIKDLCIFTSSDEEEIIDSLIDYFSQHPQTITVCMCYGKLGELTIPFGFVEKIFHLAKSLKRRIQDCVYDGPLACIEKLESEKN